MIVGDKYLCIQDSGVGTFINGNVYAVEYVKNGIPYFKPSKQVRKGQLNSMPSNHFDKFFTRLE